jgi:hypothetical protein
MHPKFLIYPGNIYLQSVSMSVPLSEYVNTISTTSRVQLPGYANIERPVLTQDVQQLMRRVLALLPDPRTNTRCFINLNDLNVRVDLLSKKPFLHDVSCTPEYDGAVARENYARVGEIFRYIIFNGEFDSLPVDFQKLLALMENMGDMRYHAIQHHCSLVQAYDKKEFFGRMYDYAHYILREKNNVSYGKVMNNLVFPPNWDIRVEQNTYLGRFYNGSWNVYQPLGTNAAKEVLRFKRNTYSHSLQHAWDRTAGKQMYNQADLGEMMEAALPLVLHSFQVALDDQGVLRDIDLKTFFH